MAAASLPGQQTPPQQPVNRIPHFVVRMRTNRSGRVQVLVGILLLLTGVLRIADAFLDDAGGLRLATGIVIMLFGATLIAVGLRLHTRSRQGGQGSKANDSE